MAVPQAQQSRIGLSVTPSNMESETVRKERHQVRKQIWVLISSLMPGVKHERQFSLINNTENQVRTWTTKDSV